MLSNFLVRKEMIEFQKAGGIQKLKQETAKDLKYGTKATLEMVTFYFPQAIKKMIRDLTPRKF